MIYINTDDELQDEEEGEIDDESTSLDDDLLSEVGIDADEVLADDELEGFGLIDETVAEEEEEKDEEELEDIDELEEDAEDVDYDSFDDIDEM